MKVALLFYRTLSSQSSASLSAGYIASHLRANGHDVELFLLKKEQNGNEINVLAKSNWDFVFYKPNFKDIDLLEANLNIVKLICPKVKVILFGPLAYINSQKLLQNYVNIDAVLKPDAEAGLGSIIDIHDTPFICRETSTHYTTVPHYDIYAHTPARDIEIKEDLKIANIEASRWCKNNCSFCHVGLISKLYNRNIIIRSPKDVKKEILELETLGKK